MGEARHLFWRHLDRELQDLEFRSDFTRASIRCVGCDAAQANHPTGERCADIVRGVKA